MRETTFLFRFFKVIDISSFKRKAFLLSYISSNSKSKGGKTNKFGNFNRLKNIDRNYISFK
ncbi:hypothetical protein ATX65_08435 [Oenococcus oeni]|nr:hypothetical protein ATX29_08725 [Oenococcus oeni]OLQ37996.1 hypothetical protein ATX65_08435 [Oenococcus oeni]